MWVLFYAHGLRSPAALQKTFTPFFCGLHLDPADCEAKNSA
ncbi:hypothetical protein [Campylobacter sp.]|nr:hypothetical protein [Campylobacter sp.]